MYLALGDIDGVPITERGEVEPELPLLVPLLEALLHEAIHPLGGLGGLGGLAHLGVQCQGLGGVGQVTAVDQVLQDLETWMDLKTSTSTWILSL